MATGGTSALLSQISDDFLECQVCLEPYRRPKVLSCLHTFCQECLEQLHKRQGHAQHLECPTCRTKTELPGSGVTALKDNFFVESLSDAVKLHKTVKETEGESSRVVCGLCESGQEAKSYCVDCKEFMCDGCINIHGRRAALKRHPLVTIDEVRSGEGLRAKSRTQPCKLHTDEALKFYCETCKEAVCRDCIMVEHKDHSYNHLAKAAGGMKKELAAVLEEADRRLAELKGKQQEIVSKKSLLKVNVTQVEDSINKAADEARKRLLDQVNAEQKDLFQQVQDIEKETEKEFCTIEDAVETAIVGLSNTSDFGRNVINHGTDLEIISVKADVQSRLQSLLPEVSPDGMRLTEGESWVRFVANGAKTDVLALVGEVPDGTTGRLGPTELGQHYSGQGQDELVTLQDEIHRTDFRATFTTLGATGRLGPTGLRRRYSGQGHEGLVTLQNGIQLFTVKYTGTYEIEAAGAAAGWGKHTPKSTRGRGALMKGTFPLEKGEVLKILVGQEGVHVVRGNGVGGGGGTFVIREDNTPLIIAGGGGGGSGLSERKATSDGTKETSGNPSSGGKAGGAYGAGAVQGGAGRVGGGGGGLLTDGARSENKFGGKDGSNGGEGGRAFVNGGVGGRGSLNNADGGFGGGGGGFGGMFFRGGGGGGGGGYSGGGRGDDEYNQCGGGGGSFNMGGEPSGESGANDGSGYVVMTLAG
ncbi:keratin, type II cytoskeletal 2 epidermal-like [Branchiostoma floridae]|uniref:Keratin, type II cytoskeletal 2 epidermal-like n=1 Tax=Branchiostoma floridae TaxID=7739 RepID=A0A9J7LMM1_BRAFL|nr:keratin, type II cytoskeletal 2 epidermal-like [Branchiostoma floridae]